LVSCLKCAEDDNVDSETIECDTKKLDEIPLFYDEEKKVSAKQLLRWQPVAFVLLRHFGCILCKAAMKKYIEIQTELEGLGIEVIAISSGTTRGIQTFKKETGFDGRVFVDPNRNLYRTLSCHRGKNLF